MDADIQKELRMLKMRKGDDSKSPKKEKGIKSVASSEGGGITVTTEGGNSISEVYDEDPVINKWCAEKDVRIIRVTDPATEKVLK